jgi:hypothetical protein
LFDAQNIRFWDPVTGDSQRVAGQGADLDDQYCPRFSPEGDLLAYLQLLVGIDRLRPDAGIMPLGPTTLQVRRVAGGELQTRGLMVELEAGPTIDCPVWSGDGTVVALQLEEGDRIWLQLVDVSAGRLLAEIDDAREPKIAGDRLFFQRPDGVWSVAVKGGDEELVVSVDRLATFDISPLGRLAWLADVDEKRAAFIAGSDASNPPQPLELEGEAHSLRWSPDGESLMVFESDDCPVGELCRGRLLIYGPGQPDELLEVPVPRCGSAARGAPPERGELCVPSGKAVWSPDGTGLAYIANGTALAVLDLTGASPARAREEPGSLGLLPIVDLDWQAR